jgi:hypothetical protein
MRINRPRRNIAGGGLRILTISELLVEDRALDFVREERYLRKVCRGSEAR